MHFVTGPGPGWLTPHPDPGAAGRRGYCQGMEHSWTLEELRDELGRWERELVAAGKAPDTVATYIGRSETFLRWLEGTYAPR